MQFLWVCTVLASVLAAVILVGALATAKGAPQEAAGAAIALCVAVIPYVFTRAVEGIGQVTWGTEMLKEARRRPA
jgi:hypothetical protein